MPKISDKTIDEIRSKADIVDIIKEYVPLTQKGKNYFGVCPFHQDHSPSMSVSRERQLFKCFSCGVGGNVFKFVSDYENISFVEAVSKVASKVGISVDIEPTNELKKNQDELAIMDLASLYFANNLNTDYGKSAKEYLYNRGLNEEMIKDFNIGLSLADNSLLEFFQKKKTDISLLVKLGLINQNGLEYQDVFKNRILFPIHNDQGEVVGFTGRVYQSDGSPKYLNSKETILFKKGNILFNYHRAKPSVRLEKKVIVVEGNMDAIRMYATGFKNTIALMGTSLTKEQIDLLSKLHAKIILMLDNDNAGELATYNVGSELISSGLEVYVVRLSGKKDPDEYIVTYGAKAMEENINHPMSFMEFKLNFLKKDKNLNDTEGLALYVKEVLKSLEGEDDITIDITLNKLAKEYGLSLDVLKREIPKKKEVLPTVKPKINKKSSYQKSIEHVLYYMMNSPKYIKVYEEKLGYFNEEVYRGIANEIIYYYANHENNLFADFLSYVETSPLKDEIYKVINSIKDADLRDDNIDDYIYCIKIKMWEDKINELKQSLKKETDLHKKRLIGESIIEIKKKEEELKKERSVKND